LTTAAIVVSLNNKQYHQDQGVYYEDVNGKTYYLYDGTYYQAKMVDGGTAYVVTSV